METHGFGEAGRGAKRKRYVFASFSKENTCKTRRTTRENAWLRTGQERSKMKTTHFRVVFERKYLNENAYKTRKTTHGNAWFRRGRAWQRENDTSSRRFRKKIYMKRDKQRVNTHGFGQAGRGANSKRRAFSTFSR